MTLFPIRPRRILFEFFVTLISAGAFAQDSPPPISTQERSAVIAGIAGALDREYIDPEVATKMIAVLRAHAKRGAYRSFATGSTFAHRITADLRAVSGDGHLWLAFYPGGARDEPIAPTIAELDSWRPAIAKDNFGFDKVARLEGNVGFLAFHGFVYRHLAARTAADAMRFLANTDALIIDLRDNGGGDPDMVNELLSYFFDERTRLNDMYFRSGNKLVENWTLPNVAGIRYGGTKPVFVLTSRRSFSAAEDFAYALKVTERARIVGETTGGGAHPARQFKVSERFALSVPYAKSINSKTGTNWERVGVVPDVTVDAEAAPALAHRMALEQVARDKLGEGAGR